MTDTTTFKWKQVLKTTPPLFHASLDYHGSYAIVQYSRKRFVLTYATPSMCCEELGAYQTLENAKRAARRHFARWHH